MELEHQVGRRRTNHQEHTYRLAGDSAGEGLPGRAAMWRVRTEVTSVLSISGDRELRVPGPNNLLALLPLPHSYPQPQPQQVVTWGPAPRRAQEAARLHTLCCFVRVTALKRLRPGGVGMASIPQRPNTLAALVATRHLILCICLPGHPHWSMTGTCCGLSVPHLPEQVAAASRT